VLNIAKNHEMKGLVHITGDAYLKFNRLMKFSKGVGFEFNNFKPQPIFQLIQETALEMGGVIRDEEMLKTFNMGWGFAVIADREDKDDLIDSFEKNAVKTEQIGRVTDSKKIVALYKEKKIAL
jgi:phosphoribosylformylglycinamidine cyclo-ligase